MPRRPLGVGLAALSVLLGGCGQYGLAERSGHAVMYLKGACKDEQAPFPQLRRCRVAATDPDDPEHGAGISVGRCFRNVNWIAIPGSSLFFRGHLETGERLTAPGSTPPCARPSTGASIGA